MTRLVEVSRRGYDTRPYAPTAAARWAAATNAGTGQQ
jgi:hypothetical protein